MKTPVGMLHLCLEIARNAVESENKPLAFDVLYALEANEIFEGHALSESKRFRRPLKKVNFH